MTSWINQKIIMAVVGSILTALGAVIVQKGWLDKDTTGQLIGALGTIIGLVVVAVLGKDAHDDNQVTKAVLASPPETRQAVVNTASQSTNTANADTVLKKVFHGG